MFGFFTKKVEKERFDEFEEAVQTAFKQAKQDSNNLGVWVKHLDSNDSELKEEILDMQENIATIKVEIENLKNMISIVSDSRVFKQQQTVFNKQLLFKGVLNSVQTGVQTVFLNHLSTTERAIVYVLLNSDMKLSYEDLAAMLGKRKATIRGQVNTIRRKSEGLIEEIVGENNKKRVYIPEKIKEKLLKVRKVRGKNKDDFNEEI